MTDITIYKPATVTVRLVDGQYVIIKPSGLTIQALNRAPPVDQTALVAALTAQIEALTRELDDYRKPAGISARVLWPVMGWEPMPVHLLSW